MSYIEICWQICRIASIVILTVLSVGISSKIYLRRHPERDKRSRKDS